MNTLAILGYHKIGPPAGETSDSRYCVPAATFEKQMAQLQNGGWTVIDDSMFLGAIASPQGLAGQFAMITFDDGYLSVLRYAAPIMKRLGFPGVMFVPTDFIGGASSFDANAPEPVDAICSWSDLHELESAGVATQSHGLAHPHYSNLTPDQIEREVSESKTILEQRMGKAIEIFAYPFDDAGKDHDATDAALRRAGYKAACHFLGGAVTLPAANPFRLTRVPVWPDTDLSLSKSFSRGTETG